MSIKKSISFTFSAQIINTLTGFLTSIIITRILGATGRGEHAIFTNSTAFAVLFFGLSINSTIPYFINSGKAKAEELLSTIILFVTGSTLLVYLVLLILQSNGSLGIALPESTRGLESRLIFTGIYFSNLLSAVISTYLLTYKKFKEVSIYTVLFQLLPLCIYLLLYTGLIPYNHENPFPAVLVVIAIVALLSFLSIMVLFIKVLPVRPVKKLLPLSLVKNFLLFSAMAYVGNVATFFNYKLDFWIVDAYRGKSQLGIYSLASQLSQLLWVLPAAIASVLYSFAGSGSTEQAVSYAIRLKQLAFYGTLVLAVIGLTLAYFFIPVLYGKEFSEAFGLMRILLFGVVPYSIPIVLASLYAARGNFKISFVISLASFGLSVLMYSVLIPRYGLTGGAISSAICYLAAATMSEIWFCRKYQVSIFNLIRIDKKVFSPSGLSNFFK